MNANTDNKQPFEWTKKRLEALCALLSSHSDIQSMSNEALSDAVLSEVWADLPLNSRKELLLNEMIDRFDKVYGIKRDDDTGEIIPRKQQQ